MDNNIKIIPFGGVRENGKTQRVFKKSGENL